MFFTKRKATVVIDFSNLKDDICNASSSTATTNWDDESDSDCQQVNCPLLPLEPTKRKYEIAVVACGSFWNPQRRFERMEGVKRVVVGYTGGRNCFPTFQNMKDHTQALFIEYNPKKVSYQQILEMWHNNDDPWSEEDLSCRSAIFVTNLEQREQALNFVMDLARSRPHEKLFVDIEQAKEFYKAEEYQQNYDAKQIKAAKEQYFLWANDKAPSGLFSILE